MTLYTHTTESMSGSSVHHGKYRLLVQTIPDGELGVLRLKRRHGYHLEKNTRPTGVLTDLIELQPRLPPPCQLLRGGNGTAGGGQMGEGSSGGGGSGTRVGWGLHLEVFQFNTSVHGEKKKIIIKQW